MFPYVPNDFTGTVADHRHYSTGTINGDILAVVALSVCYDARKQRLFFLSMKPDRTSPHKKNIALFRESIVGIAGAEKELLGEAGMSRDTGSGSKSGDSLRGSRGRRRKRGRNSKASGGLADAREVCIYPWRSDIVAHMSHNNSGGTRCPR